MSEPNFKEKLKNHIIAQDYDSIISLLNLQENKDSYVYSTIVYSIASTNLGLFSALLSFKKVVKNHLNDILDSILKKNVLNFAQEIINKVPNDTIELSSPLSISSYLNNEDAVNLFLKSEFSAKKDDYFALRISVENDSLPITKALLRNVREIPDVGEELLFYAINNNNSAMCRLILRFYKLKEGDFNALHHALNNNKENLSIPYIFLKNNARFTSPVQLKSLLTGLNISPIEFLMKYPDHPDRDMIAVILNQ